MSFPLNIWLPADLSGPWHWHDGIQDGPAVSAEEKAALASRSYSRVHVILPGQFVKILAHDLPKMREADRLSAAGFAAEDQIALPLSEQHIVLASGEDQRTALIAAQDMQDVLGVLKQASIEADGLYADFDALAGLSDPLFMDDRIIIPGALGQTLDPGWAAEFGLAPPAGGRFTPGDLLPHVHVETAINLLSGRFTQSQFGLPSFPGLIRIAALGFAAVLAWGLLQTSQTRALKTHADHLNAQAKTAYADYTGAPAPANPALAVTRALQGQGKPSGDFLTLSSVLFSATQSLEGVAVDSLQYDARKNSLVLRMIYPSFESASALEQAARREGGEFRSGGVREQGGQLIGEAVLEMGAAR